MKIGVNKTTQQLSKPKDKKIFIRFIVLRYSFRLFKILLPGISAAESLIAYIIKRGCLGRQPPLPDQYFSYCKFPVKKKVGFSWLMNWPSTGEVPVK